MRTPWLGWFRRIVIAIAVVVITLALPWAFASWLWRRWLAWEWSGPIAVAIAIDATLVLLAGIWLLWWWLPMRQVARLTIQIHDPKARADTEDNFRKTVGQALGGAAVLIGAVAAYLQFMQQKQASHDLLIRNQVSKGFEQLAGKGIVMRLGGIYALEGVMNTSPEYHKPVLEALCAFVRDSTKSQQVTLRTLLAAGLATRPDGTAGKATQNDIQAALTVIGRRKPGPGDVDLANAIIPSANLSGAHLGGADLSGANLSNGELGSADLRGADLSDADLSNADLIDADLTGLEVGGDVIQLTDLGHANLSGAHLGGADLTGAYLRDANLRGAHLREADLSDINLTGDLTGADLTRADLTRAHLTGDLTGANLTGANLTAANLTDVYGLSQAQLDRACGIEAKLPAGLTLKPCQ